MALLKLADKHDVTRLEAACAKALSYTPNPSFRSVKTILSTGQDRISADGTAAVPTDAAAHGFTRGADYYGRE